MKKSRHSETEMVTILQAGIRQLFKKDDKTE